MSIFIVVGIIAFAVIVVAVLRDGEYKRFEDNNRKQPTDEELVKDANES